MNQGRDRGPGMRDPQERRFQRWPVIFALVVVALVPVGVLLPVYQSPADTGRYSAYGEDWDDLSLLRGEVDKEARTKTIATTPLLLNDLTPEAAKEAIVFIVGMEKRYSDPEVDAIVTFVAAGGSVIVANNNPLPNALSERYGVKFYEERVLEAAFEDLQTQNTSIFECMASFDNADYVLRFNSPTGLEVDTGKATVICRTSENSSLDLNGNGLRDLSDKRGPIPLIAVSETNANGGRVVFISSPSLFMNQELLKADNLNFTNALVESLLHPSRADGGDEGPAVPGPGPGPVPVGAKEEPLMVFDESRHVHPREEQVVFNIVSFLSYLTKYPLFTIIVLINLAVLGLFWWLAHPRPKPFRHIDRLAEANPRSVEALGDIRYLRELMLLKLFASEPIAADPSILSVEALKENLKLWKPERVEKILRDRELTELLCLTELDSAAEPVLELTLPSSIRILDTYSLRKKILQWEYHAEQQ